MDYPCLLALLVLHPSLLSTPTTVLLLSASSSSSLYCISSTIPPPALLATPCSRLRLLQTHATPPQGRDVRDNVPRAGAGVPLQGRGKMRQDKTRSTTNSAGQNGSSLVEAFPEGSRQRKQQIHHPLRDRFRVSLFGMALALTPSPMPNTPVGILRCVFGSRIPPLLFPWCLPYLSHPVSLSCLVVVFVFLCVCLSLAVSTYLSVWSCLPLARPRCPPGAVLPVPA